MTKQRVVNLSANTIKTEKKIKALNRGLSVQMNRDDILEKGLNKQLKDLEKKHGISNK